MIYAIYLVLLVSAGIAFTHWCLKQYDLSPAEVFFIGGGLGLVVPHGVLAGLMMVLPFPLALFLVVAATGITLLWVLRELFVAGDILRLRFWFQAKFRNLRNSNWSACIAGLVILLVAGWYANVYLNTFVKTDDGYAGAIAGYGDVPYHLIQVSRFSQGSHLQLEDATYAGTPLKYPFIINFISGTLLRLGTPLVNAYHIPGFLFGVGGIILLYYLLKRLSLGKAWLAVGGTLLVLFSTNTRFELLLSDPFFDTSHSIGEVVKHLGHLPFNVATVWDATFPNQNVDITSVLTHFLLHQRASIMGVWAMMAIVLLWFLLLPGKKTEETNADTGSMDLNAVQGVGEKQKKPYVNGAALSIGTHNEEMRQMHKSYTTLPLGLLLALLPLLHMHGFITLTVAGMVWVIYALLQKDDHARHIFKALLWIIPFILWEVFYLLAPHAAYTWSPQLRLGWMINPGEIGGIRLDPDGFEPQWATWIRFLWQNFGVMLPISIVSITAFAVRFRKSISADMFWFFIPGSIMVFLVSNTVKLQAWDVDTNKLLAYNIFFAVCAIVMLVSHLMQGKKRTMFFGIVFAVFVLFAIPIGLLDTWARTTFIDPSTPQLFDADAVAVGGWVRSSTPQDAIFISSDSHLNPVNALGGRQVLIGYKGWLWTHGVSYGARDRLISAFINDPSGRRDTFADFGTGYVLLDGKWRYDYPELEQKLRDVFGAPVFSVGQFAIWKLQ